MRYLSILFTYIQFNLKKNIDLLGLHMVKYEGVLSLYKGLLPSLLKTGPGSAITFLVVGYANNFFRQINSNA
jgi:hypothetical protein